MLSYQKRTKPDEDQCWAQKRCVTINGFRAETVWRRLFPSTVLSLKWEFVWPEMWRAYRDGTLLLYSLSGRTSNRNISWCLEAAKLGVIMTVLLWHLTGISAALPLRCLSNVRAIWKVLNRISRRGVFPRPCGKMSIRLEFIWVRQF